MKPMDLNLLSQQIKLPLAVFLTFLLTGCLEESELEKQQKEDDLKIKAYLSTHNIQATQAENGVYYEMLEKNKDGQAPEVGEVMAVKYELRTLGGKVLETHQEDSTLLKFGWNYVIPTGINYGLDIIRKGEKVRCYLPSYLAFNAYHAGNLFGPNTNFIVDIELVDILSEEEVYKRQVDQIEEYITSQQLGEITPSSSGLYYKSLSMDLDGGEKVKTSHTVKIHYQRKYLDGTLIQKTEDDKPLTVHLNTQQLVKGFREGLLKMKEGEKALLLMPSSLAFGPSIKVIPSTLREDLWEDGYIASLVDAYSAVLYEVELVEVR